MLLGTRTTIIRQGLFPTRISFVIFFAKRRGIISFVITGCLRSPSQTPFHVTQHTLHTLDSYQRRRLIPNATSLIRIRNSEAYKVTGVRLAVETRAARHTGGVRAPKDSHLSSSSIYYFYILLLLYSLAFRPFLLSGSSLLRAKART